MNEEVFYTYVSIAFAIKIQIYKNNFQPLFLFTHHEHQKTQTKLFTIFECHITEYSALFTL